MTPAVSGAKVEYAASDVYEPHLSLTQPSPSRLFLSSSLPITVTHPSATIASMTTIQSDVSQDMPTDGEFMSFHFACLL